MVCCKVNFILSGWPALASELASWRTLARLLGRVPGQDSLLSSPRARLFKRGLNPNPGLKLLNSGLKLNFGLVLLFEGRLTLTSG